MDTKEILVAIQFAVLAAFALFRLFAASRRDAKKKA